MFGFNAFVFHLAMVLIHGANTVLVYRFATKARFFQSPEAALVAGIIFAVHPIHNEAVVWVAVLPGVLVILVVLAALLCFVRCNAAPDRGQIAVLAALFFVALLIKETGAMLLPLLGAYEFLYLMRPVGARRGASWSGRAISQNWTLYASLMAVFGVYMLMRIHALGGIAPAQGAHHKLRGTVLLLSISNILQQYFVKLIAPIHLNYFHFFEPTTSATPLVIVSLAVELCVLAAIFFLRFFYRRAPLISYGSFSCWCRYYQR